MKFNVTTDDARFIVDEKNKVVVCVIENTSDLFVDFVYQNFRISTDCDVDYARFHHHNFKNLFIDKLTMPNKFVGVARCGEDDEWNEDIGRLIAFSRAKDSLLKSFYKRAQTYLNTLDTWLAEAVDTLNNLGEKLESNTEKRHQYIESLVGEE